MDGLMYARPVRRLSFGMESPSAANTYNGNKGENMVIIASLASMHYPRSSFLYRLV